VHVVAAFPAAGAGEDCPVNAPDDCGVPLGTPIELRFDRYLLPKTVGREALALYTGATANGIFLEPEYDVVERVVTFRPGSPLTPGVVYEADLTLPDEDPNGFGIRAFDGAPLEKAHVPLRWTFRTSRLNAAAVAAVPGPSCDDAVKILGGAGCARCHTGDADAPMGLALGSAAGLLKTAIAHVAHEASTWATPSNALGDPPRFGTAMTLIAPGNPSGSYLLYKLLVNPGNYGPDGSCESTHTVPLPDGQCLAPSAAERTRLEDWFVAGEPMPPGKAALPGGIGDLRRLVDFVQSSTAKCQ
jgi:hypothetical protein